LRYKLRTLLIIVILCAVLANAIGAERNASKQVVELDAAVMTALERISPEVTEYFDVDYLNDSSDGQSCYQISRSGPLLVGSFLTLGTISVAASPGLHSISRRTEVMNGWQNGWKQSCPKS